jgi:hypothetical protein
LALKSDLANAMLGCANALYDLKRYDEVSVAYERALVLDATLAGIEFGPGTVR